MKSTTQFEPEKVKPTDTIYMAGWLIWNSNSELISDSQAANLIACLCKDISQQETEGFHEPPPTAIVFSSLFVSLWDPQINSISAFCLPFGPPGHPCMDPQSLSNIQHAASRLPINFCPLLACWSDHPTLHMTFNQASILRRKWFDLSFNTACYSSVLDEFRVPWNF